MVEVWRKAGLEAIIPVTDRLRDYWAAKVAGCSAAVAGAMTHADNGTLPPAGRALTRGHVELAVRFRHRSVSLLGRGFRVQEWLAGSTGVLELR